MKPDNDIDVPAFNGSTGAEIIDLRTERREVLVGCLQTPSSQTRGKRNRLIERQSPLTERGFACVALDRPTDPVNVGHALRAAFCYAARMLILGGDTLPGALTKIVTDPNRSYRHIPVIRADSVLDAVPEACNIVSVEIDPNARPLMEFVHPERACYVFGPENGNLATDITERSQHKIMIPTTTALNLGMTVNTVLYDRLAKSWSKLKSRRARLESQASSDFAV